MSSNVYDVGDQVRLTATFRATADDSLVNPTTVTLKVKSPAGTVTTPSATSSSTGIWTYDLDLTLEGNWYYRFVGTGAVKAAGENALIVNPSAFPA